MKERLYDLNSRDNCVTATIELADKTFKISRVVTGARVLYSNLLVERGQLLQKLAGIDTADPEQLPALEAMQSQVAQFAERKERILDDILELLLKANGIEFDKQWWQDSTDEMDVNGFIEACLSKDADVKKK